MSRIDYDEKVTALGFSKGVIVPRMRMVLELAEAIRSIVEDWDHQEIAHVSIICEMGSIDGFEAVREMYERPDFPLPRKKTL